MTERGSFVTNYLYDEDVAAEVGEALRKVSDFEDISETTSCIFTGRWRTVEISPHKAILELQSLLSPIRQKYQSRGGGEIQVIIIDERGYVWSCRRLMKPILDPSQFDSDFDSDTD